MYAKTIPITTPAVLVTDTGPQASWLRVYAPAQVLAPIQGIRHRDGTWTGTGPNYLFTGQQWHSTQIPDPNWTYTVTGPTNFPATTATVEVLENGPLRAKVKVSYTAVRPAAGDTTNYNPSSLNGYFTCTVWLEAGQPCIFVNQDTDCGPAWDINMNTGVGADRARWKGHMSDSIAQGHHQDGTLYYANGDPADRDAEVLLSECGHRTNQSYVQQLANMQMPAWDGVWWDAMPQWFTWAHNTGWYWHAYNSAGASNSNVWGIFAGDATSYLGTGHKVGMYGKPAAGTPTEHGIYSVTAMQNPMIPGYLRRKNTFGIFLGVKGTDTPADLTPTMIGISIDGYWWSLQRISSRHCQVPQLAQRHGAVLETDRPDNGFPRTAGWVWRHVSEPCRHGSHNQFSRERPGSR